MKRSLLYLFTLIACNAFGQLVPNGSFENWYTVSFEEPTGFRTSNRENYARNGASNATKTTDKHSGNFALKLETIVANGDTNIAYVVNGDPGRHTGGIPYSQRPEFLTAYVKYNIAPSDTGFILAEFRKAGVVIGGGILKLYGVQNAYTKIKVPIFFGAVINPDTVILGATSSNFEREKFVSGGSTLFLDSLSFTGPGITQSIPNGDMESWTIVSFEDLTSWTTLNQNLENQSKLSAVKSTDSHDGGYALKLETMSFENDTFGVVSTGKFGRNGGYGGTPYTKTKDTLTGYYKYMPNGVDTSFISLTFTRYIGNQTTIVSFASKALLAANTYTYFEIPFGSFVAPDTVRIDISSSSGRNGVPKPGSILYIDALKYKSDVITGIGSPKAFTSMIYPSPAQDQITLKYLLSTEEEISVTVFDVVGNILIQKTLTGQAGMNETPLNISRLNSGYYLYQIHTGSQQISGKFSKE